MDHVINFYCTFQQVHLNYTGDSNEDLKNVWPQLMKSVCFFNDVIVGKTLSLSLSLSLSLNWILYCFIPTSGTTT